MRLLSSMKKRQALFDERVPRRRYFAEYIV